MTASKSAAFLSLFLCLSLAVVVRAQDDEDQWFWIMADSKNSSAACPGRCLAVNDTGTAEYNNRPVVFVSCKASDPSESSETNTNTNQQWLHTPNSKSIKFNATAATSGSSLDLLCLQPDPETSNRTLKIATCNGHPTQQWTVANNSIASLAFDHPRYLAMNYTLAGFLNASDGPLGWREATLSPSAQHRLTTTFSMVDGTLDLNLPYPARSSEPNISHNFITNGNFEQSSYDFPNATATLTVNPSDPFSLCNWQVMKGSATLGRNPNLNPVPIMSNQTLLLKDAVVRQNVATSPGAVYTLMLKVAIARPDKSTSEESTQCYNNDTLSVNPYPSTNVHLDVEVSNRSWTTQHVSFQAGGNLLQLAFQGCASCGCYLDDVYLMQVTDSAPFPPPPPRPSPPSITDYLFPPPGPHPFTPNPWWQGEFSQSHRLSNGSVVGIVVGTAALFLRKLNRLSIGSNLLTSVPTSLGNLSCLTSLSIDCPRLTTLPASLGNLSCLTSLSIDCPLLTTLPASLGNLSCLASLSIDRPLLITLLASLGNLTCLTSFRIYSSKKLEYISHCVGVNKLLEDVRIKCPGVRELPFGAGDYAFHKLEYIQLNETGLSEISISEDCCPNLKNLQFSGNAQLMEIRTLPASINNLSLRDCKMLKNIRCIGGVVKLRRLHISACEELEELPIFAGLSLLK